MYTEHTNMNITLLPRPWQPPHSDQAELILNLSIWHARLVLQPCSCRHEHSPR